MADTLPEKPDTTAPVASAEKVAAPEAETAAEKPPSAKDADKVEEEASKKEAKDVEEPKESHTAEKLVVIATKKPADTENANAEDNEAKDAAAEDEGDTAAAAETPAAKGKSRRKSTSEPKGKTLSRKNSKVRLTHLDAQPGDHFLVKLKGYPAWPAIMCDESMLPPALMNSRPVSAARPDGTYAEAYADGGKRVHDRTFAVMYLHTNEFGWIGNTLLTELSADKAKDMITDKMRKDLKAAFELASEQNSLEHYKEILQNFQEEMIAQEEARKEAAATPKKSKKGKAAKVGSEYDDVEMADAEDTGKPKPKKRKADDDVSTPQRSESVKKPKIKLNTSSTPKATNGTPSAKSKDTAAAKAGKTKSKAKKGKEASDKKSEAAKEAKMTPEERRARKEKEILYLRHKLQRGLLTREQQPREDEMESMSGFITILENFPDLEVSIIRATKINKVLKAILKLDSIPHEEEYSFKKRSQSLLDKWNKLLAGDGAAPAASANGVNGTSEANATEKQSGANGVKDEAKDEAKDDDDTKETESDKATEDVAASAKEKAEEEKAKDGEEDAGKGKDEADEDMASAGSDPADNTA